MDVNDKKTVVLFIPEAGIYPYLRTLCVLGDAIKKSGGAVYITHDTGQMVRDQMAAMHRINDNSQIKKKKRLKKINERLFKFAQKKYNFSVIELRDMIDIKTMGDIDRMVDISQDNLENLTFKNVAVGKIAQYDFSLETKTQIYPNLSKDHKALYIAYIKNTILSILLAENICIKYDPSSIITFNQYAQSQGVRAAAAMCKVDFFAVTLASHNNIDASRFVLYKSINNVMVHCLKWPQVKDTPILPCYVSKSWDDTLFHFYNSGSHIFSKKKQGDLEIIFEKLDLDSKKKTIVVYTSSNDERGGVEKILRAWGEDVSIVDAFSSQIEWLLWLRNYCEKRNDIQFVVRIHPREGGRQFGFGSTHLDKLRTVFSEKKKSFIIVWPDDPISSYDIMELADVCLVPWSTMGLEASKVGVPVLSCTGNMYYPDDDFIQVATDPEEYKKKLDAIIKMQPKWYYLVKSIRFYHWRIFSRSLDLGETVPKDVQDDSIWPDAPKFLVPVINDILSNKQDLVEYNIKKWYDSLSNSAVDEESEAIKQGIRYFLDKIYYPPTSYQQKFGIFYRIYKKVKKEIKKIFRKVMGKKYALIKNNRYSFLDYDLEYTTDILNLKELCAKTNKNKKLRIIAVDGVHATLIHNGKMIRRMSPMVVRLVELYNSYQKGNSSF